MQVLLQRLQKGKVFSLWVKYELAKHEEELIDKYNIRKAILVEGNPREEWSRARKMAGALAIVAYIAGIFLAASQRVNDFQALLGAVPIALIVFAVAVFVIRERIRERLMPLLPVRSAFCRQRAESGSEPPHVDSAGARGISLIRETIKVGDILNGRHFACRSIFTLLSKEEELGHLAEKFAVFLDTLKDWGGRVIVEIPPGRPPIARLIGKARAAE